MLEGGQPARRRWVLARRGMGYRLPTAIFWGVIFHLVLLLPNRSLGESH
jgi:hypothetical protein